ncbi:MAG: Jag N-terminal domain-containing protein, partial [Clostridiales bacterium]|nr:Jag N-terminal domain-containing protein [Clostridiales bacterium]
MTIEVSAKKVEDAITQGLEPLGATLDEVDVEIVESGGLFRKAKVRLTLDTPETEKPQEKAEESKAPAAPAKEQDGAKEQPKPTAQKTESEPKA